MNTMNTTLMGTRLQDEAGTDFLVINVPWNWLATPEVEWDPTTMPESVFEFPHVFASCREGDGKWLYLGESSLTTICESKLGQNPGWWQKIPVLLGLSRATPRLSYPC